MIRCTALKPVARFVSKTTMSLCLFGVATIDLIPFSTTLNGKQYFSCELSTFSFYLQVLLYQHVFKLYFYIFYIIQIGNFSFCLFLVLRCYFYIIFFYKFLFKIAKRCNQNWWWNVSWENLCHDLDVKKCIHLMLFDNTLIWKFLVICETW
jgi:hypothetical protein